MGVCIQSVKKMQNKVAASKDMGTDRFDDVDPNELPFNPATDHMLEECNDWFMSSYVEKSHFKLIKIIGVGTHSTVWLVEKRMSQK